MGAIARVLARMENCAKRRSFCMGEGMLQREVEEDAVVRRVAREADGGGDTDNDLRLIP